MARKREQAKDRREKPAAKASSLATLALEAGVHPLAVRKLALR